jgi:hypothetical protein
MHAKGSDAYGSFLTTVPAHSHHRDSVIRIGDNHGATLGYEPKATYRVRS